MMWKSVSVDWRLEECERANLLLVKKNLKKESRSTLHTFKFLKVFFLS